MTLGEIMDTVEQREYLRHIRQMEMEAQHKAFQYEMTNLLYHLPLLVNNALMDIKKYPKYEDLLPDSLRKEFLELREQRVEEERKAKKWQSQKAAMELYASAHNESYKASPAGKSNAKHKFRNPN